MFVEPQIPLNGPESDILRAISRFRERKLLLLSDAVSTTPKTILLAAAADITAETVNHMLNLGGGSLFVALSRERAAAFMLSPMERPTSSVTRSTESQDRIKICLSVEAREGVTTGISASDRACTIRVLGEAQPNARKLVRPGHIFPVETREGGVLIKHALPEGALDIVTMAGFTDAAAYLEVLNGSGESVLSDEAALLAEKHSIPLLSLSELTRFRLERETIVQRVAEARLPTRLAGELRSIIYRSKIHSGEHLALVKGVIDPNEPTLTRVQAEFTFADVFGGSNPASRRQLHQSLEAIGKAGRGVLLYLRRPFAGQLKQQITSPQAKVGERPAVVMRDYGVGAQILQDLNVRKIELLTNAKAGRVGLESFGIEIVSTRPLG